MAENIRFRTEGLYDHFLSDYLGAFLGVLGRVYVYLGGIRSFRSVISVI